MGKSKYDPKHIHKYMKLSGNGQSIIWKCMDGCPHFIHHSQLHYLLGRAAICWECGKSFKLTMQSLEDEMPRCDACRNPALMEFGETDLEKVLSGRMKK